MKQKNDEEYHGCFGCIYYAYEEWFVTNDHIEICKHKPEPENVADIRDFDSTCPYYRKNSEY